MRKPPTKEEHIDHPEQLRLFPDEPSRSDRPYSSWGDHHLQDLLLLDLDAGHRDDDLKREFDARMSKAFLDLFENLGPDPNGTKMVLSPGLKRKLEESAYRQNS